MAAPAGGDTFTGVTDHPGGTAALTSSRRRSTQHLSSPLSRLRGSTTRPRSTASRPPPTAPTMRLPTVMVTTVLRVLDGGEAGNTRAGRTANARRIDRVGASRLAHCGGFHASPFGRLAG